MGVSNTGAEDAEHGSAPHRIAFRPGHIPGLARETAFPEHPDGAASKTAWLDQHDRR